AGEIIVSGFQAHDPRILGLWRRALSEGDPVARATVARVANVTRTVAMASDLSTALQHETDYRAAWEESAALAGMTGPEKDPLLMEAAGRFGESAPSRPAVELARAGRPEMVGASFDELGPILKSTRRVGPFIRFATRTNGAALSCIAAGALESGDADVWLAALHILLDSEDPPNV